MTTKVIPRLVTNNILIQNEAKREDQVWHISVEPKNNHRLSIGTGEDLRENRKLNLELLGDNSMLIIGTEKDPEVSISTSEYGTTLAMPYHYDDSGDGGSFIRFLSPDSLHQSYIRQSTQNEPVSSSFQIKAATRNCFLDHTPPLTDTSGSFSLLTFSGKMILRSDLWNGSSYDAGAGTIVISGSMLQDPDSSTCYFGFYVVDSSTAGLSSADPITLFDTTNFGGTFAPRVENNITYDATDGTFQLPSPGLYKIDCSAILQNSAISVVDILAYLNYGAGDILQFSGNSTVDSSTDPVERTISIIINVAQAGGKFRIECSPATGLLQAMVGTSISIHKLVA